MRLCLLMARRLSERVPPSCHPDRPYVAHDMCGLCYTKEWSKRTGNWRKRKYGVTPEKFAEMLAEQGGLCAICNRTEDGPLHVDHDKETGKVRALLCGRCNRGLGMFLHRPEFLNQAAEYMRRFQ